MGGNRRLRTAFKEAAVIFVAVLVVALLFNQFRDKRLSLSRDGSEDAIHTRLSELEVALPEAKRRLQEGDVIFFDVRSAGRYREGHIPTAFNFPYDSFYEELPVIRAKISPEAEIIAYGDENDFSADSAVLLREAGYENVKFFRNGWSLWEKAKLPIERLPVPENSTGN
jgi:3-mercaptopyruvate sulfurtransferase SseA